MAKTVFESINMASTNGSERIYDAVCTSEVENGTFGYLDELVEEGGVIYKFVKGTKAGKQIVVVDQPAWDYDTSKITNQRKDKFVVEAGVPFRVRVVKKNDVFGISVDGVTSTSKDKLKVGAYLTVDATSGKLVASASVTDGAVMVAKVERVRSQGAIISTALRDNGYMRMMYEAKIETLA